MSGRGGLLFPARWHTEGHAVIYTSATLALATLETLVHVDKDLLPSDRVQVEIDVPDDSGPSVEDGALPKGWRTHPGPPRLQQIGDEWLEGASTPVLRVPSAVIPTEANYLLNPRHSDLARVTVVSSLHSPTTRGCCRRNPGGRGGIGVP